MLVKSQNNSASFPTSSEPVHLSTPPRDTGRITRGLTAADTPSKSQYVKLLEKAVFEFSSDEELSDVETSPVTSKEWEAVLFDGELSPAVSHHSDLYDDSPIKFSGPRTAYEIKREYLLKRMKHVGLGMNIFP